MSKRVNFICSVSFCTKKAWAKQLCPMHLRRLKLYGNVSFRQPQKPDYIIDNETACWLWQKSIDHKGYGKKTISSGPNKKTHMAHRYYYEKNISPISEGLTLDHLCLAKSCVNPSHLEPVTNLENQWRAAKLNKEKVRFIRKSILRNVDLAKKYNVTPANIHHIKNNKTWIGV